MACDPELLERGVVMISSIDNDDADVLREHALGTGSIVGPRHIVTADHVIVDKATNEPHRTLTAVRLVTELRLFKMGLSVDRRFQGSGDERDLAILRANDLDEPWFSLGEHPHVTSEVLIAGYPSLSGSVGYFPLVRRGIVASRRYESMSGTPLTVLDIAAVGGFSGSPVIDATTGMVFAVLCGGPKSQIGADFSYAVPITTADLPGSDP